MFRSAARIARLRIFYPKKPTTKWLLICDESIESFDIAREDVFISRVVAAELRSLIFQRAGTKFFVRLPLNSAECQ